VKEGFGVTEATLSVSLALSKRAESALFIVEIV
jgi:hypothetical protein